MSLGDIESLPNNLDISFDDGIIVSSTKKKTIYSHLFWDIHRYYTDTPILSTHFVDSVLKGKSLSSNTHISLLTNIYRTVVQVYSLDTPEKQEHLLELVYLVTNNVYNVMSQLSESSVISIDILDFIELHEDPIMQDILNRCKPTRESIKETYDDIISYVNNDTRIGKNQLIRAIRSKMVNINQITQCIGVRGYLTEVDGAEFNIPIMSNFTKGFNTLYYTIAESRSAAKSLYFSDANLKDSEYFARRLQLLTMVVEKIEYHDCGSTNYLNWRILPPTYDEEGNTIYKGDLFFMIGKYYLDEETNMIKQITHNDKNLHNKVLKLRSVLFCTLSNSHNVCEVCFGALAKNISKYSNLGHLCAVTMTQQTTQSVLSTKHLDASSTGSNVVLNELTNRFFTVNRAKDSYILKKELKGKVVKMVVNREEAEGLIDILDLDNVENINPSRVTAIKYVDLIYLDKQVEHTVGLFINFDNRKAMLTTEFLRYLKDYKWTTDSKSNFIFDLTNWNFNHPVLKLPNMEYSYSDHSHQIAKVIESSMSNITERSNPHSPISTLQELFNLVNNKLNVNMAALEVIVYSLTMADKNDFRLGRNSPNMVLGIASLLTKRRSLSIAYAYEDLASVIINPISFYPDGRVDSIIDAFIKPKEVVEHQNLI